VAFMHVMVSVIHRVPPVEVGESCGDAAEAAIQPECVVDREVSDRFDVDIRPRHQMGFSAQSWREGPFEQSRLSSARLGNRGTPTLRAFSKLVAQSSIRENSNRERFSRSANLNFSRADNTRLADPLGKRSFSRRNPAPHSSLVRLD
jgi:hypothetical protein